MGMTERTFNGASGSVLERLPRARPMARPVQTGPVIPVAEPVLGEREVEYVSAAVRSGWVSSIGSFLGDFERGLAAISNAPHALAVSNGTAALHLALAALRVGPGDEVILPSFTFVATAAAVRYVGATPVFADIDPSHWCLDPSELDRLVTPRTRAIVPVHIYGHPCDMDAICEFAEQRGISVIEDAAEAMGARCRGRLVGALGHMGVFSFYGNKLITTGEGGAVLTGDGELAERARWLCDHAMDRRRRYWHEEVGFNYRMTNMQAALGVAQLERFDELIERKRTIASRYIEGLADLPQLQPQKQASWAESAWWMFTLRVGPESPVDRDALAGALRNAGIDSRPAFPPVHVMPPYRTGETLPVTETLARDGLTLPSSATLREDDQERVIECVRAACGLDRARRARRAA
jgi:perosamine synthetase